MVVVVGANQNISVTGTGIVCSTPLPIGDQNMEKYDDVMHGDGGTASPDFPNPSE